MTFQEFQATKREATREEVEREGMTYITEQTKRILLYAHGLYIESTEGWGEEMEKQGKWYLILERSEYVSDDLQKLEKLLYEWGAGEWGEDAIAH